MPVGSISQAVKLITNGINVDLTYTYYFASSFPTYYNVTPGINVPFGTTAGGSYTIASTDFMDLTSASESVAAAALTAIDRVAGISFSYLNNQSADIVISGLNLTLYGASGGQVGAFAWQPIGTHPARSDLWVLQGGGTPSFIHTAVQHELLHSVGLADVIPPTGSPLYSGIEDTSQYTIMSYQVHPEENRRVTELQLYDIAALQAIYGRDDGHNSGDTPINQFTETSGAYSGQDRIFSIWDGDGKDTIDASGLSNSALIDLRPGHFSSIGPNAGVQVTAGSSPALPNDGRSNISIAFGAYIENAKGSSAGDLLIGNLLTNKLEGGGGDDVIYAEGADSVHEAGDGAYDRVTSAGASKTAPPPTTVQSFVSDPTKQEDHLLGGAGDDHLRGGRGNDLIEGGADDDYIIGGGGDDVIWGGDKDSDQGTADGTDKVDYSLANAGIAITYSGTTSSATLTIGDGQGGTDALHSIEEIKGTWRRDFFSYSGDIPTGYSLIIDALAGQTGNDIIHVGGSTADQGLTILVQGQSGTSYLRSNNTNGQIELRNFHTQIIGSSYDDTITDEADGEKRINGGDGDDVITVGGDAGNAMIGGGPGDDTLTGGDGNDVIRGDDVLLPGEAANILNGGGGADHIISTGRYDQIDGGDGSDWIDVYRGLEILIFGGAGNDVIKSGPQNGVINIALAGAGGHDMVLRPTGGSYDQGVSFALEGVSQSDITIIWDVTLSSGGYGYFGDAVVLVESTGATFFVPDVQGEVHFDGGVASPTLPNSLHSIRFDGAMFYQYYHGDMTIVTGDVSSYATAIDDYAQATAGDSGDPGTSDNDDLGGGPGDDALSGGGGDDNFSSSGGSDLIDGGSGEDTLNLFGTLSGFTISQGGNGIVIVDDPSGLEGTMTLTSVEKIYFATDNEEYTVGDFFGYEGTAGDDTITGTHRDNQISGLAGDDILSGGGGDDLIDGGADDDELSGGSGYDALHGGLGDDIYLHVFGDEWDVVTDEGGFDILSFGAGLLASDLRAEIEGDDYFLWFEGAPGGVIIPGGLLAGGEIEELHFDDETIWTAENLYDFAYVPPIVGTESDDPALLGDWRDDDIQGLGGNDVINGGSGDDLIDGGGGTDTAVYTGSSDHFIIYWYDGSLSIGDYGGIEGNEVLTGIEFLFFDGDDFTIDVDDFPRGTTGNDILAGSARDDIIYAMEGDDELDGGSGNDELYGSLGNDLYLLGDGNDNAVDDGGDDTYSYDPGDGDDTILEYAGFDILTFGAGIDHADVIVVGDGSNYYLTFVGAAGGVTLWDAQLEDHAIEEVRFADETVWTAGDLYDLAFGQQQMAMFAGEERLLLMGGGASFQAAERLDFGVPCIA